MGNNSSAVKNHENEYIAETYTSGLQNKAKFG